MTRVIEGNLTISDAKFGIVVARFNNFITDQLLEGALSTLKRHGASEIDITVVHVPGSFEIPLSLKQLAETGEYDALIALGAVIRGATSHYDHVIAGVTSGVARVSLDYSLPVIFGVITTENIEQAIERAGTKAGNKGSDAAVAAIEMVNVCRQIKAPRSIKVKAV